MDGEAASANDPDQAPAMLIVGDEPPVTSFECSQLAAKTTAALSNRRT